MGEFIVPQWTNQLYAQLLRAGRPFADQCMNMGEPVSNSWNIPRITTGATTAAQTEASALSNQDQVSDSVTGIMQTIGGYSIASYQLVDLAEPGMDQILFADLTSSLNQQVDSSLLNSATTSAKGLLQLASINSVTFTATTPTVALLWPYFFQAKSAIEKNTYLEVDFCIMHPTTWNWILSGLDSNNRPLFLSTSGNAFNAMAEYNLNAQGWAGNIAGIPVLIDANMPVTGGAGTNQGTIALVNRSALLVKEGAARYKVADQRSVETLQYYFVAFKYLQRIFGRHPTKISAITGTGLVVQSGF
jgi:HK97 family phage major capsid protein